MIKNYIVIALRNLTRNKGYSAINILGFSIGIACCLLILMSVRHELSYDTFHENADRIVRVSLDINDHSLATTPSMLAPSLQNATPAVEKWVRLFEPTRFGPAVVNTGDKQFLEDSFVYADSTFFDVFSFEFIFGNPETALSHPRALVLPQSTAEKLFGSANPLGKTVNARAGFSAGDFVVTGVVQNIPSNSHFSFDYLASMNTLHGWSQLHDTQIGGFTFYSYLLLSSRESIASLEEVTKTFVKNNIPEGRIDKVGFIPLTDLYLGSNLEFEIRPMGSMRAVVVFILIAVMILLIATFNYVNLSTARSSRRGTEVGVRKALGAGKLQLIKQFYTESILLTFISVIVALVLVELFKESFLALIDQPVTASLFVDLSSWGMLAAITVVIAALAGGYPALLLSSYKPVQVLKGAPGATGTDGTLRKGLVVSQFSISIFLILCTAILYRQTDYMLTKDLGFDKEHVIVLPAHEIDTLTGQDVVKQKILRRPGVLSAAYMSNIPGKGFAEYGSQHLHGEDRVTTAAGAADVDVVNTLGLELLAGDGFPDNPAYRKEQGYVYLINEKLAGGFGWSPEEAVGKSFRIGNREGEVAGVIKDFNYQSLRNEVEPLTLFLDPEMHNYLLVKVASDDIRKTLASLEQVWQEVAPHQPFTFEFLDGQLHALYKTEIETRNLLLLFSGLAIFIACMGLIGLSSFMIDRRAREIGIRKVLGASVLSITTLLSKEFVKLILAGFVIAIPIAWFAMNRWLEDFAYRIDVGPGVFLLAGLATALIALATVSWQSIRSALANPVESLKSK